MKSLAFFFALVAGIGVVRGQSTTGASALAVTTHSGDVYVLVGSPTQGQIEPYEGVFRFRRSTPGDDNTYQGIKFGASSNTPEFPVIDAFGLAADKFSQVYLVNNKGDRSYRPVDWTTAPTHYVWSKDFHFSHVGAYDIQHGHLVGANEGWHAFDTGKVRVIHKDGREEWLDAYAHGATSSAGIDFTHPTAAQTGAQWTGESCEVRAWYEGAYPPSYNYCGATTPEFASAPGLINGSPQNGVDRSANWWKARYLGTSDPSDLVLPPPVNAHPPWAKSLAHEGIVNNPPHAAPFMHDSVCLFPTSGTNVVIPWPYAWLDQEPAVIGAPHDCRAPWNPGAYPYGAMNGGRAIMTSHGWLAKQYGSIEFKVARMFLQHYLDTPDASALGITPGVSQSGDAIYQSLGTKITTNQWNSCGDQCIRASPQTTRENPPTSGAVAFSTFGEQLAAQRTYAISQVNGQSKLLQLAMQGSIWHTDEVYPNATTSTGPRVIDLTPGQQFQSVGTSPFNQQRDYVYISSAPPGRFAVSGSYFGTGGTVWTLDPAAGIIHWSDRNERDNVPTVDGTIDVGANVTNIGADGQGSVYYLRTAKDPENAAINPPSSDPLAAGISPTNPINVASSPYFYSLQDDPNSRYRYVTFIQLVGKEVWKTSKYLGSANRKIGFAKKGFNLWSRQQVKLNNGIALPEGAGATWTGTEVAWANNVYDQVSTPDVDLTVRSEVASPNIALPPPPGTNVLDINHVSGSGAIWNGARVSPAQHMQTFDWAEDADNSDHYFALENAPVLNGLMRMGIGKENTNFAPNDTDGDGSTGKFVNGMIWPASLTDPSVATEANKFRYKWEVVNTTFRTPVPVPFTYVGGVSGYNTAENTNTWTPLATDYNTIDTDYINATIDPNTDQVQVHPIKMPQILDPGKYEVRLKVKGAYWNVQFIDFDSPVNLTPAAFSMETTQIIKVKAGTPTNNNYVWGLRMRGNSGTPGGIYPNVMIPEAGDPSRPPNPQIWCQGNVQFYHGQDYTSSSAMQKATGVGVWDYTWEYRGSPPTSGAIHPPNYPAASTADVKNDGDGIWGTRYDSLLDPTRFADRDQSGNPSQQLHDWQAIRYDWQMHWLDKDGHPHDLVYARGNLADLIVLTRAGMQGQLTGGQPFIETASEPERRYTFRIPLVYPSTAAMQQAVPPTFVGQPNLGTLVSPVAASPAWYVPTEPAGLEFTCRVYYPKVKWVPIKSAVPPYDVEKDSNGVPLYWHLEDDPGPGTGDLQGLWPGSYERTGSPAPSGFSLTTPYQLDSDPTGDDRDDYFELGVRGTAPPRVLANVGTNFNFTTVSPGYTWNATAGKALANDMAIVAIDNNPYSHFSDYKTPETPSPETPKLKFFAYQVGTDSRMRDNRSGLGLNNPSTRFGFDISTRGSGFAHLDEQDYYLVSGQTAAVPTNHLPAGGGDYLFQVVDIAQNSSANTGYGGNDFGTMLTHGQPLFPHFESADSVIAQSQTDPNNFYAFNNPAAAQFNYRFSNYSQAGTNLPMPLFVDQNAMPIKFFGRAETRLRLESDADPNTAGSQATPMALVTVQDSQPPNVKVELLDFRSGLPVYYIVNGDFTRPFSTNYDGTDYTVVKKSLDNRPITTLPAYTGERQTHYFSEPRLALGANPVDFTTGLFDPTIPQPPGALYYRIEQEAKFQLKVTACDNRMDPNPEASAVTVAVTTAGNGTHDHFPTAGKTFVMDGKRIWSNTHFYPHHGDSDNIIVTVGDAAGNSRAISLRIEVVKHALDYNVIGSDGGQKK